MYQHGIRVTEQPTSLVTPIQGTAALPIIWGTAPVNQVENPAVNELILANNFQEAVERLGYSDDYEKYTLCQSMDIHFRNFNIGPIILCNVLDPKKHKKENPLQTIDITNKQGILPFFDVILDDIKIKKGEDTLEKEVDYVLSFSDDGKVIVTMIGGGKGENATTIDVESSSIDVTKVTTNDIIGGYDIATGQETGMELIRQVYPKFQLVPGLLLAPGWSQEPVIGAVLTAKTKNINGVFNAMALLDLDTKKAKKYTDCLEVKNNSGFVSEQSVVLYPKLKVGEKQYAYSAVYAALIANADAQNGDVPNLSPSNKLLTVTGSVLEDGTEIYLDQQQANLLNGQGIVTIINDGGWRTWGNNTACYPANTDPKDRWICCKRFFLWWGNSFILTYKSRVDDPSNRRLIESICDSENIRGNSFVAQDKCAGAKIVFLPDENPITNLIDGKLKFRQFLAPYVPAEDIENVLEFDPNMIESALGGE